MRLRALAVVVALLAGSGLAPATAAPTVTGGLEVVGWGDDFNGQSAPPVVPAGRHVVQVGGGAGFSLALLDDGSMVAGGDPGQVVAAFLPDRRDVASIDVGVVDALALTTDGKIVQWGLDTMAEDIPPPPAELADEVATDVSLGERHALAVTSDGKVHAWGSNTHGQTDVPAVLDGATVVDVDAQGDRSVALTASGDVVEWGLPEASAPPAPDGSRYVAVSASYSYSLAITDTGQVVQWGDTSQVGAVPPGLADVRIRAISAGVVRALALTDDGRVLSWGTDRFPTPAALTGRTVLAIDAGGMGQYFAVTPGHLAGARASLTGFPVVGRTLTAHTTPDADSVDYEWLRDGTVVHGASGPTYPVTRADLGRRLSVRVTMHRAEYDDATVESTPMGAVRLPAVTLTVRADRYRVRRGHAFQLSAARLAAGEAYTVRIGGRSVATGHASSAGRVSRRVVVRTGTALGVKVVSVTGSQYDRTGHDTVRVLRR
ncbi:MAG: hypothetical protein HOQ22_01095 [Nocardioidaceae bacterium]|nr:hypothetical protein [Nocardioidaceae bacterium]NUS49625.1 hypothetical protein [Nocardioidaceae bacterium]